MEVLWIDDITFIELFDSVVRVFIYFTINEFEISRCCLRSCVRRERLIGCSLGDDPISLVHGYRMY